ncbi:MAG: TolC family protein [Cytophagales bacterium]|nr:TolC family protein [Cytophagales bacterium]
MKQIVLYFSIIFLMLFSTVIRAQRENYLDQYIAIGLERNLLIDQQILEVEKSHQDIRNTRGSLLPKVDLNARYTMANGGRSFQMPLGDLMNPVYNTLNALVGEGTFQSIENQELNFNRTTDVDTRISIVQPIYDSRLLVQYKIQNELTAIAGVDLSIAKRDVVFDIKQSYFTYLKALKIKELLLDTRGLVEENLRVSKVLFANDKITEDAVWRSKTEVRKVDFQIAGAEKQYQMAKRYFNQLLNREMTDSIYTSEIETSALIRDFATSGYMNREELEKLSVAKNVACNQEKLASSNNIPNFYLVLDAGYQGSSYVFNSESDYFLASVIMSWNLFSGFKNNAQRQKAKIELQRLEAQYFDVRNSLQLQIEEARLEFEKSSKNYQTTIAAEHEANANFRIVNRKFEEGLATQIELIDARTFMTNAASENIIARYDVLISKAAYERATAGYTFNSIN